MDIAHLNKTALAKAIGISLNALSYKISGKRPFNFDEVVKICQLCNISCDGELREIFLR